MSITSALFRLARLSADLSAISRAGRQRSARPILKRIANKAIGRSIVSKLFIR